eukprot:10691859-Lingulodinium_polyedra.AAC.1
MQLIKWKGDDRIEEFYRGYRLIVAAQRVPVDQRILLEILMGCARQSKIPSHQFAVFEMLDLDSPERTHEKLCLLITKYTQRHRLTENR